MVIKYTLGNKPDSGLHLGTVTFSSVTVGFFLGVEKVWNGKAAITASAPLAPSCEATKPQGT